MWAGAGTGKAKIITIFGSSLDMNLVEITTYSIYFDELYYLLYKAITVFICKMVILSEALLSNDILHLISEG